MIIDGRMLSELSVDEIELRMDVQERFICESLSRYHPTSAILAWLDTLRAIEECINLVAADWTGIDEEFFEELVASPMIRFVAEPHYLISVRNRLAKKFSANFSTRFSNLMIQGVAISHAFASQDIFDFAASISDVQTFMAYLQSRRRHFVAMLHLMATACRGRDKIQPLDTLNVVLPLVEMYAIPRQGGQEVLNIRAAQQKLALSDGSDVELAMLNAMFLEPERASIIDMPVTSERVEAEGRLENLKDDRLFSAAELRNDIIVIEAAYAEFDLSLTEFRSCADIIKKLSECHTDRDFWVRIAPSDLNHLFQMSSASKLLQRAFINSSPRYTDCLSTYAPMVLVGDVYLSTVSLLSRFLYNWRSICLDRVKRYQIRSGFIFEQAVASRLTYQGYHVQEITRINRAEFDVITIKDGIIWNFQCKNNFTSLDRVDSNAKLFANYNKGLVRAYEKALKKELGRQDLLKKRLGIGHVQHMVVSKFPVVTDNVRIVPFSRIDQLDRRVSSVLACEGS